MKIRLIACLLIINSPLYCNLEKDLQNSHHIAEKAMAEKDYATARQAYKDILDHIDIRRLGNSPKYIVDWPTYIDTVLRYAETCEKLQDPEPGRLAVEKLLAKKPPQEFAHKVHLFHAQRTSPQLAYIEMQEVAKVLPPEYWHGEERSYLRALEYNLDKYYDALIQKAKLYLFASCYDEAAHTYKEILEGIEKGYYPKAEQSTTIAEPYIRFRLAETLYRQSQKKVEGQETVRSFAEFYRYKHQYERFLSVAMQAQNANNTHPYAQAILEQALFYNRNENFTKSKEYFTTLLTLNISKKNAILTRLCLARIYLEEHDTKSAQEILLPIANDPDAQYEVAYLNGLGAFRNQDYYSASLHFTKANSSQIKTSWLGDSLLHLVWCQLRQENITTDLGSIQSILTNLKDEKAWLTLACLHLKTKTQDKAFREQLIQKIPYFSQNGIMQSYVFLAISASGLEEKKVYFQKANDPTFKDLPEYQGCCLLATLHTEKPLSNFALSLDAPYDVNSSIILTALKEYSFKNEQSEDNSLLFLKGLVAFYKNDFQGIEKNLSAYLQSEPHGTLADKALFVLAVMYHWNQQHELARKNYLHLATTFPDSPFAAQCWFAAAEMSQKLQDQTDAYALCCTNCFQLYPESTYAPRAFFALFPYQSYWEGDNKALTHLKNFPNLFPNSPLLAQVYYLIGKNEVPENAKKAFEKSAALFKLGSKDETDLHKLMAHYHVAFELVRMFEKKNPFLSLEILKRVIEDCQKPHHPLKQHTKQYNQVYSAAESWCAEISVKHARVFSQKENG